MYLNKMTDISLNDAPAFAVFVLVYGLCRLVICFVFDRIGKAIKVVKLMKFTHRTFDLVHYSLSAIIGLIALWDQPYLKCWFWAKECKDMIVTQTANGFECTGWEKLYYAFFATYYIVDFCYIRTASEPIMFTVHHLITLSMITLSILCQMPTVGLVIMFLHDVVDVVLYIAKLGDYLGIGWQKDIAWIAFASSWSFCRCVNYPIIVYWISLLWNIPNEKQLFIRITTGLLWFLYGMHIIWEIKILRALYRYAAASVSTDIRSDDAEKAKAAKLAKKQKQEKKRT